MIDLHVHTNYSDGIWNVKKVLSEAEKAKVEILSITDHDNVDAHLELRDNDYSDLFSGKIINGVELNVMIDGVKIEILAYDFDLDKINNWCLENYNKEISIDERIKEFNDMVSSAREHGIILDDVEYDPTKGWPVEFIYPEIKKHKENKKKFDDMAWNDINYFFRCFTCDLDFPVYVDFSFFFPKLADAVNKIHEAGGKVFLAHLFKYPIKDYNGFLENLINNKLVDGLEVYHSSFTKEQIDYLYQYCKKHGLLMCGGSDSHGDKHSENKIGIGNNNLNINKAIINNWYYL